MKLISFIISHLKKIAFLQVQNVKSMIKRRNISNTNNNHKNRDWKNDKFDF